MKKNKIIVKISEGLGNQLFMYANAYSLSQKYHLDLLVDAESGYYKKSIYPYMLNNFSITSNYATDKNIFNTPIKNFIKKYLIFSDSLSKKKRFIFEKKNKKKITSYFPLTINTSLSTTYIDGNFESEKYFIDYKDKILNEFRILNPEKFNNDYLKLIKNNNVIAISVRQNRYSERNSNYQSVNSINKSINFVKNTVDYIYDAIDYLKPKILDPIFLVWSNDFTNLEKYLPKNKFIFVNNDSAKYMADFYLLTQCKYHIVGPSTFSWWGAWLSNFDNKICVRPSKINPSNNLDFWPDSWVSI